MKEQALIKEEMVYYGSDQVAFKDLMAIAMGSKNSNLMTRLEDLGIRKLASMSMNELQEIPGINEAFAFKIHAIFGLAKQLYTSKKEQTEVIRSPKDVAELMDYLKFETQEHFICLFLNVKNEVLSRKTIFVGSLNSSIVHPREIFKEAFKLSAGGIICCHNHPSGNPAPSPEDIKVTERLKDCGLTLGIELMDHIIIGDNTYISLKEKGYL